MSLSNEAFRMILNQPFLRAAVERRAPYLLGRLVERYGRAEDAEDAAEIAAAVGFVAGIVWAGVERFGYSRQQFIELLTLYIDHGREYAQSQLRPHV